MTTVPNDGLCANPSVYALNNHAPFRRRSVSISQVG